MNESKSSRQSYIDVLVAQETLRMQVDGVRQWKELKESTTRTTTEWFGWNGFSWSILDWDSCVNISLTWRKKYRIPWWPLSRLTTAFHQLGDGSQADNDSCCLRFGDQCAYLRNVYSKRSKIHSLSLSPSCIFFSSYSTETGTTEVAGLHFFPLSFNIIISESKNVKKKETQETNFSSETRFTQHKMQGSWKLFARMMVMHFFFLLLPSCLSSHHTFTAECTHLSWSRPQDRRQNRRKKDQEERSEVRGEKRRRAEKKDESKRCPHHKITLSWSQKEEGKEDKMGRRATGGKEEKNEEKDGKNTDVCVSVLWMKEEGKERVIYW